MSVMSELDIDRQEMEHFFLPVEPMPCEFCEGRGLITIHNYDGAGSDADDQPCLHCDGTGYETEET
jgi:DnaJ-class molecular chaperone